MCKGKKIIEGYVSGISWLGPWSMMYEWEGETEKMRSRRLMEDWGGDGEDELNVLLG